MALPTRVQRGIDPLESAQHEFDSMLGRFFGNRMMDNGNYLAPYAVDVREDADHIYVEAELPGFKKDEIDISVENQSLTIAAEHRSQKDEKSADSAASCCRRLWILKASWPSSMMES
jgi:HSP20 family protein